MRRPRLWLWLVVILSLVGGYQSWTTRTIPQPPGILAAGDRCPTREDTGAGACEVIWVESFE